MSIAEAKIKEYVDNLFESTNELSSIKTDNVDQDFAKYYKISK